GGLKCWGGPGLVGDRTRSFRPEPVDVFGLTDGVKAVSAGKVHTCALKVDGGVVCWGVGLQGQLGDGTRDETLEPHAVVGLGEAVQGLASGREHTCVLGVDGAVWCWGANGEGQLGVTTPTISDTPVRVDGLPSDVRSLSAGANHSCALASDGRAFCWGSNGKGELGDGTPAATSLPVQVTQLSVALASVSAGDRHTCARAVTGEGYCWGHNAFGELGDDTSLDSLVPVSPLGLPGVVTELVAGEGMSCAIGGAGQAFCWGRNSEGQLGDGTRLHRPRPVAVQGLAEATKAVAVGTGFSCAIGGVHQALCWGRNADGQLGDGTTDDRTAPAPVKGL
ncbi:MAG TPA: hypothetical protein VEY30_13220, partial [Myxococcaceae bacterium]|nr:hypothetical protein [Myxococcaceae bacterium]